MRVCLFLMIPLLCFAQNATVYDLTPAESSEGARLYKAKNDADKAWDDWTGRMRQKYSTTGTCLSVPISICAGPLEFTDDFKHAVPKAEPPSKPWGLGNCTINSPAAVW